MLLLFFVMCGYALLRCLHMYGLSMMNHLDNDESGENRQTLFK